MPQRPLPYPGNAARSYQLLWAKEDDGVQPKPPSSSLATARMRPRTQTLQGKPMCQTGSTGVLALSSVA